MASLAQWAAKGAHLLEVELLLEPGDRLALTAPAGWMSAAVCLAAWWAGIVVDLDGDAEVAVVHEFRTASPAARDVLWIGDDLDGSPLGGVGDEVWPRAVQTFPDQPPPPNGRGDRVALEHAGRRWTQTQALQAASDLVPGHGTLGVDGDPDPARALLAVALRPLLTGRHTVVLAGTDRAAADGDRVQQWLDDGQAPGVIA